MSKIKIFAKYLINQPFDALREVILSLKDAIFHINNPINWFWASIFLAIYFVYVDERLMVLFATIMLVAYIIVLWRRGDWMSEHRAVRGYSLGKKRKKRSEEEEKW